ncbi:MAG: hypothetical protein JWM68_1293 [Verrucomicrobiales bacterium]|nr:hypothetical protein [Verrucomicrobiales bacterium]
MLTVDLVVAMGILVLAVIPLAFSFLNEQKLCRAYYFRSVTMEIVDGEMEKLMAGDWRNYKEGEQPYRVKAEAVKNLHGNFVFEIRSDKIRLVFEPSGNDKGGRVMREAKIK